MDTKRNPTYTVDTKLNPNAEWRRENLQYVVFVQDRASRKIIGAATLRPFAVSLNPEKRVDTSVDTARTSAYATSINLKAWWSPDGENRSHSSSRWARG